MDHGGGVLAGEREPLHRLVRKSLLASLPHTAKDEAALGALSLQDLLTAYYTWSGRQIPARARILMISRELRAKRPRLSMHMQVGLASVFETVRRGGDLRPHLSTGSACGFDRKGRAKPERRRRDIDLLLAAWGLHHLHLSTQLRADGWSERTTDVLIAAVHRDHFFAVDVVPHGRENDQWWTVRPDLLSIMARNWPEVESLLQPMRSKARLERTFSMEEQLKLRQAGVSVLSEVEGRVCLPGSIAVNGTPLSSTQRAQRITCLLASCEEQRQELEAEAVRLVARLDEGVEKEPTWGAHFTDEAELHLLYGGAVRFNLN